MTDGKDTNTLRAKEVREFSDLQRTVSWDMYEIEDRQRFISKCPPYVNVDEDSPIGANDSISFYSFFSEGSTVHIDYIDLNHT